MAKTARHAGVKIVTGDTKVVECGACDKLFLNTVGVVPKERRHLPIMTARPGDMVIEAVTMARVSLRAEAVTLQINTGDGNHLEVDIAAR